MIEKFTASNGWTIETHFCGDELFLDNDEGYNSLEAGFLIKEDMQALEEYFVDKLTREGKIPFMFEGHIAIPHPERPNSDRCVTVVLSNGVSYEAWECDTSDPIAKAWFEAHPIEPEYRKAKEGEIWDIIDKTGRTYRCLVSESELRGLLFYSSEGFCPSVEHYQYITEAAKILDAPGDE